MYVYIYIYKERVGRFSSNLHRKFAAGIVVPRTLFSICGSEGNERERAPGDIVRLYLRFIYRRKLLLVNGERACKSDLISRSARVKIPISGRLRDKS